MSTNTDERRRRKERLARDLDDALANATPTMDEVAARPAKKGPRIQGITASEFAAREPRVSYQQVLIWLREYDLSFPAEHNWQKIADVMGLTLDEFRGRYLFSQPAAPAPSQDAARDEVLENLLREVAELRAMIEAQQEEGPARRVAGQAPASRRRSRR